MGVSFGERQKEEKDKECWLLMGVEATDEEVA